MMELEDEDEIYQPHTSAGRIQLKKTYHLFLEEWKKKLER